MGVSQAGDSTSTRAQAQRTDLFSISVGRTDE